MPIVLVKLTREVRFYRMYRQRNGLQQLRTIQQPRTDGHSKQTLFTPTAVTRTNSQTSAATVQFTQNADCMQKAMPFDTTFNRSLHTSPTYIQRTILKSSFTSRPNLIQEVEVAVGSGLVERAEVIGLLSPTGGKPSVGKTVGTGGRLVVLGNSGTVVGTHAQALLTCAAPPLQACAA